MLQLDPNKKKQLDSNIKSMLDNGASQEDVMKYANDFKEKFSIKKKDGTKSNSTSTSVSPKQDSVQKNGSSGTQEFEYKPVYDERGREVKIKNEKGELVPYMEKVPKGFASSTEEREIVRQEQKQKASKPIVTSSNLKKYQEATKVSDEEKATLQQEVNDEFDKKGFWNGITDGAKKGFNFLADTFTAIGTFGTETEASKNFKMETDSFAKEKKQAEQELIASKQPITPEAIAEKAKEIKLKKKIDGLVVDKNNEFLSNLSEEEIKSLNLERVKQYKTLSDKDKYIATQSEILKNNFERDTKDYTTAVAIIKKNKEQGIETNQSLIDFAIEKENSLKEKLTQVKELEAEYISNKENIGSAEEEVDFLKRNYDTADKIKTLAKIGFGDIYNSLSNKLPLMVDDLDQAIFELLRPGSSEGVLSDDERQKLIDNSIDWENAKELAKSKVKKDVDFENLSLSNFGQFFAQEIGTQLSTFAQMAMPGGIVSIGMTSTFDKYGKMEQESNNIAFEFNGKQFNGFEKENGEIVDSLGNTYDPKEVNITSIREADKSTANKFFTSVTFGTAEAVLGAMPTKNIFGRALSSFSASGERTLFRQSVKEFVKAKGTGVLNDTATEVISEGATQIIQNIADISSGNKNIGIYDGVDHAAVSAGMLSFFMSASPAVAGLALKPFSESKENKQVNENLQEIFALQSQLNNTEISDISKTTIQNRINELEKANSEVLDKIASRTKGISKETFDAIKDVNKKQELLILQASEISKDNSLDTEIKKKIIADLESEFNALETKRNKLASGKSTILDALSDNESTRLKENAANLLINEEKAKGKTDEEINFTEEEINKKAIEIYNQNAVQQEATITETKQEAQPQAEVQKTEQEVLETPIIENETAPSQVDNVDGNVQPGNNVVEPSGTTEQENNQASNIQPTDNSRNVEVKREIKIADKGQSYTVEKVDGDIIITDKKGKAPSKATERKILDEYSKTINFTQGTRVDDSFESSAETYLDDVAEKSQNPSEIAEAIAYVENADMNEGKVDPIQIAIAQALGEKSVEKSSFTNINDRNNITQSIALQYFAKKGKGKGLDQIAMEVEYEVFGDYNANNPRITEEDVANFIVDNPRGAVDFLNKTKNEALDKLKTAFTSVTGLPAKPQFIQNAIAQNNEAKNQLFIGNSLYALSEENLLSLANEYQQFVEFESNGRQQETTNETSEGSVNSDNNQELGKESRVQEARGIETSGESNISNRSSQAELGSSNDAYSRQQDAYNRLGERIRKAEKELKRQLTNFEKEDLERTTALEYAKENNIWIEDFYSLGSRKLVGGQENTLVLDEKEGVVYKSNNLFNSKNSITELFEGVEAHNSIFPETKYEFVGYTGIDKGTDKVPYVEPIFKQDFITEADQANKEEIANYMTSIGFEKITDTSFKNKDYTVFDLHPRNVLKDSNGTIYVVDAEFKKNDSEEKSKIDALKKWLDDTDKRLKDFGDETLGINIPIVVARGAVKAMKAAVSTAQTVQEIIQAGLDFVKQSEWYQNLSKKEQNDVDANFQDYINKPFQGTETKKSRLKIEEEIQERLDNNESEQDIIDSISDKREKMIAQDYIERQKNLSVPEVRKKIAESFNKADEALKDKKTTTEKIDKAFRNFIARFFDRQFVPKFILNKAGGRLVRNYLIASKGATGYAKQMYDEAYDKIYKGLTSAEIKTLDKMIQLRRFIAIDKNRSENNMPDVVHPDFINRQDAEIELAELEKEFGVEKFKDLNKRADAYFDEFRGLLTEMQKSGLISKESLDMFFEIDYQPRMFLEFLQNNETDFVPETSSNASLSADQIKKLEEGLNTSLIYDSQYLLSRSMNIRAKAIAMNNTNKKLVEFMEKQAKVVDDLRNKKDKTQKEKDTIKYFDELSKRVKINPIIGFTDTGSPKYKYALPNGFKNAYYYIDGVKHSIMMEEALHEQYFDSAKGFLNGNTKEVVAMASGTAVVKALATGNNPTFFITNTPRDFFFIATFSEEYGMSVLVNMAKLAKDAFLGVRDIQKGNGNFKNFVKYGGMMDFLKDQGKLKHTEIQKLFDKVDNKKREGVSTVLNFVTASKLQMYSEIGFRMAVFNRSVKNQLKELGYTKIEDVKDQNQVDDIYTNAVASARGIMDFNQGGKITKDADAFIPYLNAATQGTRVMFDNFRERPFETTFRTAQTAGVFSGLAIGLSVAAFSAFGDDDDEMTPTERYLYAKKGVSKYDQTNYFIIFTGQKTESGQYSYIRIAKPQQITPFFSMTDGIMTSFIKAKIGDESPTDAIDNVMFAFEKNISPLEFSVTGNIARNPFLKSALSYSTGYDFYRGEDLSYLRGKVPVPAEGFESKTVEDFYKKIGEESGMSPVRFKAAVESFITTPSTSPYVGFLYGGLDAMASDKDGKEVMSKLGKDLLKSTFNRVRKETTDFNRRLENDKALKKKIEQVEIENLKTKSLFKKYANAYTNKEMSVAEISKELEKVAQDNPFEAKRLKKMIKDKIKNKDVSPYVFEIKYAKSAESKALMLIDLFGDDLKDMSKLEPEEKKLLFQMKKMGAINKEVLFEYNRIITE